MVTILLCCVDTPFLCTSMWCYCTGPGVWTLLKIRGHGLPFLINWLVYVLCCDRIHVWFLRHRDLKLLVYYVMWTHKNRTFYVRIVIPISTHHHLCNPIMCMLKSLLPFQGHIYTWRHHFNTGNGWTLNAPHLSSHIHIHIVEGIWALACTHTRSFFFYGKISLEHISATFLSRSPLHTHCRPIVPMDYMGDEYFNLKPLVIKYERRLLKVQALQ